MWRRVILGLEEDRRVAMFALGADEGEERYSPVSSQHGVGRPRTASYLGSDSSMLALVCWRQKGCVYGTYDIGS